MLTFQCEACRQDWPMFDTLPAAAPGTETTNGYTGTNNCHTTKTEQNILEVFNRVRESIGTLQKCRVAGCPPNKSLIQNQVRLYRCLLAMYSSITYTIKHGNSSMAVPI